MVEKRDVVHFFIDKVATFEKELSKEVKSPNFITKNDPKHAHARIQIKLFLSPNGTVRLSSFN